MQANLSDLKTFCPFCEVFFSKDLVLAFAFLIFKYINFDLLIKHESWILFIIHNKLHHISKI